MSLKESFLKELSSIEELLNSDEDQQSKAVSDFLFTFSDKIKEYNRFTRGKGNIQEWVEAHRMISGKPFRFDYASIEMMLGEKDKKLDRAPRPYLMQYYNDQTRDKTVIKCRQCIPEETIIITIDDNKNKSFKRLGDLFKENYRGKIIFNNGNDSIANVVDIWKSGIKEMIRIRTKSGKSLDCSLEERIWEDNKKKFVLAKDLKIGDTLKLYEDKFGKGNDKQLALTFGYWFCDGTSFYNKWKKKIAFFTNTNWKYIKEFYENTNEVRIYPKFKKEKKRFDVFLKDKNKLKMKLHEWKIFGKNKQFRTIPEEMMNLNEECTAIMLNRMFAADGWYSFKLHKKYKSFRGGIGISSMSLEFLHQLQVLLYRFGIRSSIKKEKTLNGKLITGRLGLINSKDTLLFMEKIGIYDKISNKDIKKVKDLLSTRKENTRRHEQYEDFNDSQIMTISRIEDRETFDLSISDKKWHNFYANNILVSNSEFTESEINKNIFLASTRPYTNIRHIFPTSGMANKIAREKISPAIEGSPDIKAGLVRPINLTIKAFSNGSFYTIDSSWTDYQGRGPSSDEITFDEYESQNPQIEDVYSESTSHSELGKKTRISTPVFPDAGIDLMFKKGCQYEWWIVCPKCKKEQVMEFPDNLINFFDLSSIDQESEEYQKRLNKAYIGCKFCKEYIDKTSQHYLSTSKWKTNRPHLANTRASYRVTYMMLPWKTGKEILYKYHNFKYINQFWNEVMGYAYISPSARISREIFEQCQERSFTNTFQKIGQAKNVSVGVDWGDTSWVVVRANGFSPEEKKCRIIYVERIDRDNLFKMNYDVKDNAVQAKRVADIAVFFNARIIVNDANGIGADRNTYLVKMFPTKAYGCFYDTNEQEKQKKKEKLIIPQWNESARRVTVSRLNSMRDMLREYEDRKVAIPRLDNNIEEFIKHHANLAIERYEDEKTGTPYEIIGHTGPDHLAHADNYAKIGFDKFVNSYSNVRVGVINGNDDDPPEFDDNLHPLMK